MKLCLVIATAIAITSFELADAGILQTARVIVFGGTKIFKSWFQSECQPLEIMNVTNDTNTTFAKIRFKIGGSECKSGGSIANLKPVIIATSTFTTFWLK